jgi:lipoic acid synthetase
VLETMDVLIGAGVKVLTIGQYLQPSPKHLEVVEYVTPEQFAFYEEEGLNRGFKYVESGPLVRSSYHAEKHINALK